MTDEKILELAQRAGFSWARATDRVDGQARVWADVRDDGECIEELRKFAALVRREAEQIAMTELGNFLIEHDAELTFGLATGCRCMCCHSFKITEDDGNLGRVLCENEDMEGLLADIRAFAAQEES